MTYSFNFILMLVAALLFLNQPAMACDECGDHAGDHTDHHEPGHKHSHSHKQTKDVKAMDKKLSEQNSFGAALNPKAEKIELADLLAQPSRHFHKTVQVQGKVDNVCSEKGCWLALKNGEQNVRVKFKDYGFFVPQTIRGRNVSVEGELVEKSVDEQIEGTQEVRQKKQIFFVATGVEINAEPTSASKTKKSI